MHHEQVECPLQACRMAMIAEILYCWAKYENWRERRRQRKAMQGYEAASEDLVYFRPVEHTDMGSIKKLEAAGYPADEAASPEALDFRAIEVSSGHTISDDSHKLPKHQPDLLVGYICGTLTTADTLTHESMGKHETDGQTLCIHSVCVAAEYQRKGIASRMLKAYLQFVQQSCPQACSVQLICKKNLISLYETAGFTLMGPSSIVHGQDQWYDLNMCLTEDISAFSRWFQVAYTKTIVVLLPLSFQVNQDCLFTPNHYFVCDDIRLLSFACQALQEFAT